MPGSPQPVLDDLTVKILIAFIAAILAIGGTLLIERFKNRLLVLKKKISYQLIGMSSLSDTWGDIKIFYNELPVNNLYFFHAEIVNDTSKDAPKDFVVTFSAEPDAYFLRETGTIHNGDVMLDLKLDPTYLDYFLDVKDRWLKQPVEERNYLSPIQKEVNQVSRHKKFVLPMLNRKSTASFDFLIVSNSAEVPILSIGVYEPGISLTWLDTPEKSKKRLLWKNVIVTAVWIGLAFPIMQYAPSVKFAVGLMFANSFIAYFIGLGFFHLLKTSKLI